MKILLSHRYFWPDSAPYAVMLRSIGEGLADDNHDVHIFASRPSYRGTKPAPRTEQLGLLNVRRCYAMNENRKNAAVRILNVILYTFALFCQIIRLRPDVVTASTFPPVIAGWMASLAARLVGANFIYHMQDIHPEVSLYSGGRLGKGLAFRLLRWLDNQTLSRAQTIVVLSVDMANTIRARSIRDLNIVVINNFLLANFDPKGIRQDFLAPEGKKRVIFAGNLGRFQNLTLLSEGVAKCLERHPELELMFLGDGEMEANLKHRWQDNAQVRFEPFLPFSEAQQVIASADIGLVSLSKNIYRVAYPSKVLSYLGLGVPILALVEPESALATMLIDNDLGTVPSANTSEEIACALDRLLKNEISKDYVKSVYASRFNQSRVVEQWQSIIQLAK